jgi:FO synthase
MNESITRAAGARHGQEMTAETLERAITSCGRRPYQRNTLYGMALAREVGRPLPELKVQAI